MYVQYKNDSKMCLPLSIRRSRREGRKNWRAIGFEHALVLSPCAAFELCSFLARSRQFLLIGACPLAAPAVSTRSCTFPKVIVSAPKHFFGFRTCKYWTDDLRCAPPTQVEGPFARWGCTLMILQNNELPLWQNQQMLLSMLTTPIHHLFWKRIFEGMTWEAGQWYEANYRRNTEIDDWE